MLREKRRTSISSDKGQRPSPGAPVNLSADSNNGTFTGVQHGNNTINITNNSYVNSLQKDNTTADCLESLRFRGMNSRVGNISHSPGTCEWLLQDPAYRQWGGCDRNLLWIKGHPGSGKSTLVHFLKSRISRERPNIPYWQPLYFFFNARGSILEYSKKGFLRSVLYQLLHIDWKENDGTNSANVRQAFLDKIVREATNDAINWEEAELRNCIEALMWSLAAKRQIYLFVDALDEAGKRIAREMAVYLSNLSRESASRKVKLLICFSCRHWPEVVAESALKVLVEGKNAGDIKDFVRKEFENAGMHSTRFDGLKMALIKKANGIFQWVSIVTARITTHFLDGINNEHALLRKLNELPRDLYQLYEKLLQTIEEDERVQSILLFQWLCYSIRPLTLYELRYVLALDCAKPPKSLDDLKNSEGFVADDSEFTGADSLIKRFRHLSRGLAELSQEEDSVIQVVHETVNEYLRTDGINHLRNATPVVLSYAAHWQISRSCLNYLKVYPIKNTAFQSSSFFARALPDQDNEPLPEDDLFDYALQNWLYHISAVEEEEEGLKQSDLILLADAELREKLTRHYTYRGICPAEFLRTEGWTLFHMAADQGFHKLLSMLIQEQVADINCTNLGGQTPVDLAILKGHKLNVDLLLATKEVSLFGDRYVELLEETSSQGNERAVQLLLDNGVDPNAGVGYSVGALQAAALRGQDCIVQLLIANGAQINLQRGRYGNALQAAVAGRQMSTLWLLLEKGAILNNPADYFGSAIQMAVRHDHRQAFQMLLNIGSSFDGLESDFGATLDSAAHYGREQIVQDLLEKVNRFDSSRLASTRALLMAVHSGQEHIVRLLIANGARINAQQGQSNYPVLAAVQDGFMQILQLLIDEGAAVNAQAGYSTYPVLAAIQCNRKEMLRLLIHHGAVINPLKGFDTFPLLKAVEFDNEQIVRLLIQKGADVNAGGQLQRYPLHAALELKDRGILRLLLKNGANVNVSSGSYENALQIAVKKPDEDLIRLLLEHGADVDARGGVDWTALQMAAAQGKAEMIRLLIGNGADVNASGGMYGTALSAAAAFSSVGVVLLLCEMGADLNLHEQRYGSALQAAARKGNAQVVRILIERGADVNIRGGGLPSPYALAEQYGYVSIALWLQGKGALSLS